MIGFLKRWWAIAAGVVVMCAIAIVGLFERPIDTRRTYRIGTRGASLSAGPDGRIDNLGVAVLSEAGRRAGIRLQWIDSPEGPDQALALGRVELWPLLAELPARKRTFHITAPWMTSERCLVAKGPPPSTWKAVPVAYGLGPLSLIDGSLPGAAPVYKGNEVSAIQAVCMNQAGGAFVSIHSLGALILRRPEGCETTPLTITPLRNTNLRTGIGSKRESARVADRLRSEIARMALDGSLTALFHKHAIFSGSETEVIYEVQNAERRTQLMIYGAGGLGLMLMVFAWQVHHVRESRNMAEKANRAKSEFLANMSHEIRTPLNGIAGMLEVLTRSDLNVDQREMVGIIQKSSESLVTIVNDILDLSKIEAGSMRVEEILFGLHCAVEGVAKLLSPLANAKGLAFEVAFDPDLPRRVKGDPLRLRQVLLNLAANAIKFTETGSVRVEVAPGGDQSVGPAILFRVIDTGIGIDQQIARHLFRPFTQADTATTRKYGGTGLGLAISRRLVMLMGGSIAVESTPGKGSTFWFVIPLEVAQEAGMERPLAEIPLHPQTDSASEKADPIRTNSKDLPTACGTPMTLGRVLIVDDNPVNQLVAVRAIHNIGYDAFIAGSGEAALDAIGNAPFDLILMDCQMPGMDGYQTAAEIRRRERSLSRIPIIAMTANSVEGDEERCAAAGMDDYLTKPLRIAALKGTLHRWIKQPEDCVSTVRTHPVA
jgi:signal transduction histidine kinase/CheY-like chemotaxis protein